MSHGRLRVLFLCLAASIVPACGGGGGGGGGSIVTFNKARGLAGSAGSIVRTDDGTGDIYLGGGFGGFDGMQSANVIRLNADGTPDPGFDVGTGFNRSLWEIALATDGSGDLYAVGSFTTYDGAASPYVVRLNPDGTIDAGFTVGAGFNDTTFTVAVSEEGTGDIYVGGTFTTYQGTGRVRICRINSDGSIDGGFLPGVGFDSIPRVIAPAIDGSGDIYVGGSFTTYQGTASNRIIRLNSDGSIDAAFNVGTGFDGSVETLILPNDASGDVYVGGYFQNYNGTPVNRIVRLNPDGSIDGGFSVGTGFNSSVQSITLAEDGTGDVLVAGFFTSYQGAATRNIARLNTDGSKDASLSTGTGTLGGPTAIEPVGGGSGDVYVTGSFTGYNGTAYSGVLRLSSTGTPVPVFPTGSGFNTTVHALARTGGGDLYAGGMFTTYGTSSSGRIIRLNSNGTIDGGFSVGAGFNNTVRALALAVDGTDDIYAGGDFQTYDGIGSAARITRLNSDGSLDAAFSVGGGCNARVLTIAPATDGSGDVYVGGQFTTYGGAASSRIVRINPDGSRDTGFVVGTGFDGDVETIVMAVDGSGDLYVGGDFTFYNASAQSRIVRLNSDGSVDGGFATGAGCNAVVKTILPRGDGSGDLYVGGDFTMYNVSARNRIIRLNSDGSLDLTFQIGTGFPQQVDSIILEGDNVGDITVGGSFSSYDGTPSQGIARLKSDGVYDAIFSVGTGFVGPVTVLAEGGAFADVYVGGGFSGYQAWPAHRIAHLMPDGSIE